MRRAAIVLASLSSLLAGPLARAQGTSIEKCTGNFEEAQLKEKRGKLIEAEQLFGACAESKCPAMIRTDCATKRDEMLRRIPTITIVVRDASGNDVSAYVEVDGKPLTDRVHAQSVDPGEHVVNYRPEGKKPATHKIVVVEGEKARVISITAKEGKDAEPAVTGEAPSSSAHPPKPESHSLVAPLIVGGIGVVALIAGIGAQVLAISEDKKREDLTADLERAKLDGESETNVIEIEKSRKSRADAAENNQLVALVLGTTGFVFIAGGIVLYFVTKPSSSSKSSFAPVVAPGFAGASYGLRF